MFLGTRSDVLLITSAYFVVTFQHFVFW